jgi:DNA-binding HxlR family transcriptional regulator
MANVATKRSYGDLCGIARAFDVVGERWALLVVRELVLGPKRFTDLRAGLPKLSSEVLAQRLRELEDAGVVRRRTLPPPGAARVYELTPRGLDLEPVLLALGRWGSLAPVPPGDAGLGVDAMVLALPTLFDPAAAEGLDAGYELRLGDQAFSVRVADGRLEVTRGSADRPDAVVTTDTGTLAAVLWQGRALADAHRAGDVQIDGDGRAVERLLALFPLPPVAGGRPTPAPARPTHASRARG